MLMWSHYARLHQGFCIEYETPIFSKENAIIYRNLFPVIYTDVRQDLSQLSLNWRAKGRPSDGELWDIYKYCLLSKSLDWKYQQEWRLISYDDDITDKNYNCDFFKIKKVYLGNKMQSDDRKEIIEISSHDDWKGKMRERLSEIYKVLSHTDRNGMANPDAALHFAVMDINKRGGGSLVGNDNHIENYCKQYDSFIREEIEIINPDIVAIIGSNLFNMNLHGKYLGAIKENNKDYFIVDNKKIPILSLWQTSYYQGQCEVAKGYEDNKIIGKQVAKALEEMKRYGL